IRAPYIIRDRRAQIIDDAGRERSRQIALRHSRVWIEHQCLLEQANRLDTNLTRWRSQGCSTTAQNVVQRIGGLGWPSGFRADEFEVECHRDPPGDLFLESE